MQAITQYNKYFVVSVPFFVQFMGSTNDNSTVLGSSHIQQNSKLFYNELSTPLLFENFQSVLNDCQG